MASHLAGRGVALRDALPPDMTLVGVGSFSNRTQELVFSSTYRAAGRGVRVIYQVRQYSGPTAV